MVGQVKPLPRRIVALRERPVSRFVSNHHEAISSTEQEAMFSRAGKIVDTFIPKDRSTGKGRGFACQIWVKKRSRDRSRVGKRQILEREKS